MYWKSDTLLASTLINFMLYIRRKYVKHKIYIATIPQPASCLFIIFMHLRK